MKQNFAGPPMRRDSGSMAELEVRTLVEQAKVNIKQFYDMYDQKMKEKITHPLFDGIEEDKVLSLTGQVELLEQEMVRRVRELVWAQGLLKKDQLATKKRLGDAVSDKQLEITLSGFRNTVQEQLTSMTQDMHELRATMNNLKFEVTTQVVNSLKNTNP